MVARVSSCQEYFDTLQDRFIADKAGGVDASYVYELSGDGGGSWTVTVKGGELSVKEGAVDSPDVTYKMKAGRLREPGQRRSERDQGVHDAQAQAHRQQDAGQEDERLSATA